MTVKNSRKKSPVTYCEIPLFFSLVDYRNNYFTSSNPNKIIEFYNGFDNREQLIQWMRERPKGVANIHEVEGDKDIIVVIPTADINGKYARESVDNIFKGLHIIFVESGEVPDPYFNYAHNCNVGVKKAMEYHPKWVIVAGDDLIKIDSINKLQKQLVSIDHTKVEYVHCNPTVYHSQLSLIGSLSLYSNIYLIVKHKSRAFARLRIMKKFEVRFDRIPNKRFFSIFVKKKKIIRENGDFGIYSSNFIKKKEFKLYDETFINGWEETELAFKIAVEQASIVGIDFSINEYYGSTLGTGYQRTLREIAGLIYFNYKWGDKL